jgi:hypothetical protein
MANPDAFNFDYEYAKYEEIGKLLQSVQLAKSLFRSASKDATERQENFDHLSKELEF